MPSGLLCYVETSALLAALLEHDPEVLTLLRAEGPKVTSALTFAEAYRAVLRARREGRLTPSQERTAIRALRTFERRCTVVDVSAAVLERSARPFPVEPVRTLDAIHLATVELLGEHPSLTMVLTRDRRVEDNTKVIGYVVP